MYKLTIRSNMENQGLRNWYKPLYDQDCFLVVLPLLICFFECNASVVFLLDIAV